MKTIILTKGRIAVVDLLNTAPNFTQWDKPTISPKGEFQHDGETSDHNRNLPTKGKNVPESGT